MHNEHSPQADPTAAVGSAEMFREELTEMSGTKMPGDLLQWRPGRFPRTTPEDTLD
jgi:hypothetical protein